MATTPIKYRISSVAPKPVADSVKGVSLTSLEIDGNFRSVKDSIEAESARIDDIILNGIGTIMARHSATAADSQTVFNLPFTYSPGANNLVVFVNGLLMERGVDYTETSGSVVTFNSGLSVGQEVTFLTNVSPAPEAPLYSAAGITSYTLASNGVQTSFTLPVAVLNKDNTQVYINGIYQEKSGYSIAGSVLVFSSAPPSGNVEVVVQSTLAIGENLATQVSYVPAGTGAVPTNVQSKLRETVSVKDFGALGDGLTDDTAAFQAAAVAAKGSNAAGRVFVPNGTYRIGRVGIRDVVFVGQSTMGTVLKAISGASSQFMLDATIDLDGVTSNTNGGGWAENLTIDGNNTGRSGLRTYGGGATPKNLVVTNCNYGISMGLPIWASVLNCYLPLNAIGFHTYSGPGDAATSLTLQGVWADSCTTYGFHITQLYYSSFINCASQNTPTGWFVEGNANGLPAVYSLQFVGCAHEGTGLPFNFKKVRDLTLMNPRIVGFSANTHLVTLDDVSGSVIDFSTAGSPGGGYYHLNVVNATAGDGSIQVLGGVVTYASSAERYINNLGCSANGVAARISGVRLAWGNGTAVQRHYSEVANIDGYTGLNLYDYAGVRLAAFRRIGTPIFATNGDIFTPATYLNNGDVSFAVDTANSRIKFVVKDGSGNVKTGYVNVT